MERGLYPTLSGDSITTVLGTKKIKIVSYVSSPGIIHLSGLLKYVYIYAQIMYVCKREKERRDYIKINF